MLSQVLSFSFYTRLKDVVIKSDYTLDAIDASGQQHSGSRTKSILLALLR